MPQTSKGEDWGSTGAEIPNGGKMLLKETVCYNNNNFCSHPHILPSEIRTVPGHQGRQRPRRGHETCHNEMFTQYPAAHSFAYPSQVPSSHCQLLLVSLVPHITQVLTYRPSCIIGVRITMCNCDCRENNGWNGQSAFSGLLVLQL